MRRKALLRAGEDFVVLEESKFEAETQVQDALSLNAMATPPPAALTGPTLAGGSSQADDCVHACARD